MRVCLINPPRIQPKTWGKPNVFPPIVLATVAAVLEKKHEVTLIDAPTEGWENLEELDESKYWVGLNAKTIATRIASMNPVVAVLEIPFSGWSKTAFEVAATIKGVSRDLMGVSQPLFSDDNSLLIMMGGHIYDYEKQKSDLIAKGHRFKYNHSDLEYCLRLFEEYGANAFERLNGCFVIAVYNLLTQELGAVC